MFDIFLDSSNFLGKAISLHGEIGIDIKADLVEWFSIAISTEEFIVPLIVATTVEIAV